MDITSITTFLEKLSLLLENKKIICVYLILSVLILFIIILIRLIIKIKNCYDDKSKTEELYNVFLDFLIAAVIDIILLTILGPNGIIISPLVGYCFAIWFRPNYLTKTKNTGDDLKKDSVVINIGKETMTQDSNEEKVDEQVNLEDMLVTEEDLNFTKEPDKFKKNLKEILNKQSTLLKIQSDELDKQSVELDKQSNSLNVLVNSLMLNRRLTLQDKIYNCLSKQYATKEEYDRITTLYLDYKSLNGNHGIDILYEKFEKLPIREESRKRRVENEVFCTDENEV